MTPKFGYIHPLFTFYCIPIKGLAWSWMVWMFLASVSPPALLTISAFFLEENGWLYRLEACNLKPWSTALQLTRVCTPCGTYCASVREWNKWSQFNYHGERSLHLILATHYTTWMTRWCSGVVIGRVLWACCRNELEQEARWKSTGLSQIYTPRLPLHF